MLPKILKQFNILLKKGFVEPGPRGEIVSRIILAIVAYKLKTGTDKSVQKFLEELYHKDSMPNLDGFSDKFINGTVSFTHFSAIEYVPEKEDLEWFYTRKCAFIMKRNHPGADICIPVKLATDTDKYSLIIVQIKNIDTTSIKSDKNYPGSAKSMLDCSYVFQKSDLKDHDEPCLCLYWQLGYHYRYMESPSTVSTRRSELSSNLCWATFGLKHYKIDNIEDVLIDILTSHISPFDIEWQVDNEEEGDIYYEDEIRIMNPRKYKKEIE
ncbi:hypothetical protein RclHR1_14590005 [Rhizophagus clarus]|uniref:Uncharacterized protein n=1 Tax=Rhizophagus clarus TaxID=94130 RepID=A0A2Z6QD07_9GLOM|nr:hypothetical protein RclHR1_14590005 [Rhizophagus clarus]GES76179.1 hypothetical protein GLOIN_2v1781572 [Rhizophagus clarus]